MMTESELKKILTTIKKFMPKELYSLEEAAHQLGISKNRIWKDFVLTAKIGVVQIDLPGGGIQYKVPSGEIKKFININTKIYLDALNKAV